MNIIQKEHITKDEKTKKNYSIHISIIVCRVCLYTRYLFGRSSVDGRTLYGVELWMVHGINYHSFCCMV